MAGTHPFSKSGMEGRENRGKGGEERRGEGREGEGRLRIVFE